MFWSTIRPIHLEVIQDIYTSEKMTFTQYQATIYLLYKKGVREDIRNWRPISLLNNDYKSITKILSNRLRSVIDEIIHEDQRGCILGRNSSDCVRMLEDLIENEADENTCMLLLDQEKAFYRVEFTWLFKTREAFGFGKKIIKLIKILYKDINSAILTNGRISRFFSSKARCQARRLTFSLAIYHTGRAFSTDSPGFP